MAVPFRVSLLILHIPAESGAYSRDCSRCSRRRPYILPHPLRYKVSSKYEISVLQLLYCMGTSYACTRIKKKLASIFLNTLRSKSTLVQSTGSRELHTHQTTVDGEKKSPTVITPRCPDNRRELRVHATTVVFVVVVITYRA